MKKEVIVALDVSDPFSALQLAKAVKPYTSWVKVGSILFTLSGPALIHGLKELGMKIMLDLKYHDIPNTVGKACTAAAELGVDMLTVHTLGGAGMIEAACSAVKNSRTKVLGITILTSHTTLSLRQINMENPEDIEGHVHDLALLGLLRGLDGIVCSAEETPALVKLKKGTKEIINKINEDFYIINPGIRLLGENTQDQKRVATPQSAFSAGATHIVVGRPIYEARDPAKAIENLINSL